jgi:hypothetical protein
MKFEMVQNRLIVRFQEGNTMKLQRALAVLSVLLVLVSFQACGKSSSSGGTGPTGSMALSVTDAPGDFDHVWITVTDVWIHTNGAAGPNDAGWRKYPLSSSKTLDLLTLANGNAQSIWNDIILPVGDYQQIRLVLADTDDPLTDSALTADNGSALKYNNAVVVNSVEYPLHIPDARHGIRLVPVVGTFKIREGGMLRLAIDFDAGHDIVDFRTGEYILKPRLAYFDLDHAGAIVGKLASSGSTTTPRFVIKAERLASEGTNTYHVVRRWTVPKPDGTFILYPVSTLVTSTWDVVVRGLDHQTVIIKGVPVTEGSTPVSGASDVGTITMTAATSPDYAVTGAITSPSGAWIQFYQTLPGTGEYPYEIRFRHFNPLTGAFTILFPLSNDVLRVGAYGALPISLVSVTPQEGVGGYQAAAGAILYDRSPYEAISSSSSVVSFGSLTVTSPYQGNAVAGLISLRPAMMSTMDRGVLFAVHGGMIVNAINIGSNAGGGGQIVSGGTYTMVNLPGGSAATPLPGAFYGIEALGWTSTPSSLKAFAILQVADLRAGSDTANLIMLPLP